MIVIYTNEVTNRLKYVFDFVFIEYFGIQISYQINGIIKSDDCVISYNIKPEMDLHFGAVDLLFRNDIAPLNPDVFSWKDCIAFFSVKNGAFDFDVFSAIFYLISRYEEYLPFEEDEHGRFPSHNNLLVKHNMEKLPIVEVWLSHLKEIILAKYPNLIFKKRNFSMVSTIDVDHLFSFKGKPLLKNFGGLFKRPKTAIARIKTLFGIDNDPFDTFNWINEVHHAQKTKAKLFFLLNNNSEYDSQINSNSLAFKNKVRNLKMQEFEFAWHPSYCFLSSNAEEEEIEKFIHLFGEKPKETRQHFLRIKYPNYFEKLIQLGVTSDYSLGFSDKNGFRSGISVPHYFFNLEKDTSTSLQIIPFCIADHVDRFYLKRSFEEILNEYNFIVQNINKIDGQLVTLFHNDTFEKDSKGNNWKVLFLKLLFLSNKKQ